MPSLHIIYASTSGHTEYVVDVLVRMLQKEAKNVIVTEQRAEVAQPEDLLKGDVLVLASGTWNTGGVEGQLNLHMHEYLVHRAKDADLKGKTVAIITLGDDRYFYTTRANEHLRRFVLDHNGKVCERALMIVNEPYGQEEKIEKWAKQLLEYLGKNQELRIMN